MLLGKKLELKGTAQQTWHRNHVGRTKDVVTSAVCLYFNIVVTRSQTHVPSKLRTKKMNPTRF